VAFISPSVGIAALGNESQHDEQNIIASQWARGDLGRPRSTSPESRPLAGFFHNI
jgi:hypothetical protein